MRAFEAAATAAAPTLGAAGLRALADRISAGWPENAVLSGMGEEWTQGRTYDFTDPEIQAKVPWGGTDHLARATMDGQTGWEHAIAALPLFKDMTAFFAKTGVTHSPTMTIIGWPDGTQTYFRPYAQLQNDPMYRYVASKSFINGRNERSMVKLTEVEPPAGIVTGESSGISHAVSETAMPCSVSSPSLVKVTEPAGF